MLWKNGWISSRVTYRSITFPTEKRLHLHFLRQSPMSRIGGKHSARIGLGNGPKFVWCKYGWTPKWSHYGESPHGKTLCEVIEPILNYGIMRWRTVNLWVKLSYMDISCHSISGGMWNITKLLTVRDLWPYEVGEPLISLIEAPKGQSALKNKLF